MRKAVLDSTVLVSAFLRPNGVAHQLLLHAQAGEFLIVLSEEILSETERVLLTYHRIRKRYHYSDEQVDGYLSALRSVSLVTSAPPIVRIVTRDPNDDMIIACALKAQTTHIISRDKDLLSMLKYDRITIVSPEEFIGALRSLK
jgi:uncharacterized protein